MNWIFAFLSALFLEQQMVYALSSYSSRNSGRRRLYVHTTSFASTISQSIRNKVIQPLHVASTSSSPELIQNLIETSTNTTDQLNGLDRDIIQQPSTKATPEL